MENLFARHPKVKKLNPNLQYFIDTSSQESKNIANEWYRDFIDRDHKFIQEFQTSFEPMLWELYCFAVLKQMGCQVDFSHVRPDFVVQSPERFLIECTIAREAVGMPSEMDQKEKINPSQDLKQRVDYATVRLFNSIQTKHQKYVKDYQKLEHVQNQPYIIGVAPFEQATFQAPCMEPIRKILWAETVEKINGRYELQEFSSIAKNEKTKLQLGIFLDDSYEEISGVLFSNLVTISKLNGMAQEKNMIFATEHYNAKSSQSKVKISYNATSDLLFQVHQLACHLYQSREIEIEKNYADRMKLEEQIFSSYRETLTDGLHLFVNPFAKYPLCEETLQRFYENDVSVHQYSFDTRSESVEHLIDHHLLRRNTMRMRFS